ncbi:RNA-directed DNA polymerase, eukaryota, reverse transcriptase zinc-binding domain protein [Tanacetum coccineum]
MNVPLIINEVISWTKKVSGKLMIFKVDFEKAFDSINWNFIDDIMSQMGFGVKWRDWIFSCLRSGFSSILINGSPSKEFKLSKGLRQGDPLSTFKFIIAMEALHIAMMEAREKGVFKGVEVGKNKVAISHLQYADDALLVGVKNDEVIRVARSEASFGGVEEKKVSWVSWSKVCAPVRSRGLGIGSLKALNLCILSKWIWIWRTNKDALWYRILHSIHGSKGGDFLTYASIDTKGSWYDILKACHDVNSLSIPLSSFFTRYIGEGVSIKFWDEEWPGVELKSRPDGWSWALESSGKFSFKFLQVKLDEKILTSSHEKTRRNSLVPKKVNTLVWRADKDSLAARCNIDRRNIDLHSVLCPMCEEDVESLDHLMGRCSWSRSIWNFIFKWWGFSLSGDLDYKCVCNFVNRLSTEKKECFRRFISNALKLSFSHLFGIFGEAEMLMEKENHHFSCSMAAIRTKTEPLEERRGGWEEEEPSYFRTSDSRHREDSEGGQVKSSPRRRKSNTYNKMTSSAFWDTVRKQKYPFTPRIWHFRLSRLGCPAIVQKHTLRWRSAGSLKVISIGAKTEDWAMTTWCQILFNSTSRGCQSSVWTGKLPKEFRSTAYEDLRDNV